LSQSARFLLKSDDAKNIIETIEKTVKSKWYDIARKRNTYMAALEAASVGQNIVPFAEFLARLVDDGMKGKSAPPVPSE